MGQEDEQRPSTRDRLSAIKDDRRFRSINRVMRLLGNQPDALIETLHAVQDSFGFLDTETMEYVAHELKVPLSRVFAVATFYHYFSLKPPGNHTCVICQGTACYIEGASNILKAIHKQIGVVPGETTADGEVSLMIARCLGSCSLAPAAVFDGQVIGRLTSQAVLEQLGKWSSHDSDA